MKRIAITLAMICGLMAFAAPAMAQCYRGYGGGGYGGGGYGGYGYGGYGYGGYGRGGYSGNGFGGGVPVGSYFGNGGHDYQPHWHVTQTPFGQNTWYGNGPHDAMPHQHTSTPGSYQGYSNTGAGPTTSIYNPQPYYFAPW